MMHLQPQIRRNLSNDFDNPFSTLGSLSSYERNISTATKRNEELESVLRAQADSGGAQNRTER